MMMIWMFRGYHHHQNYHHHHHYHHHRRRHADELLHTPVEWEMIACVKVSLVKYYTFTRRISLRIAFPHHHHHHPTIIITIIITANSMLVIRYTLRIPCDSDRTLWRSEYACRTMSDSRCHAGWGWGWVGGEEVEWTMRGFIAAMAVRPSKT
jgi:hypothetical protein